MNKPEPEPMMGPIVRTFATEDPAVLVAVVACGDMMDDHELCHIGSESYARATEGMVSQPQIQAVELVGPAPVRDPQDAAWLRANYTWFDVHAGAHDAAARHQADIERMLSTANTIGASAPDEDTTFEP